MPSLAVRNSLVELLQEPLRDSSAGTATAQPSRQIYIGSPSRACCSIAFSIAALSASVARSSNGNSRTFAGSLVTILRNARLAHCSACLKYNVEIRIHESWEATLHLAPFAREVRSFGILRRQSAPRLRYPSLSKRLSSNYLTNIENIV